MSKQRLSWVDALKSVAIILVVIGHVLDGWIDTNVWSIYSAVLRGGYNFIYGFHMPLCFMISGYLYQLAYYKSGIADNEKIKKHCADFAIVYIVFSFCMWCFKLLLSGYVNKSIDAISILLIWTKPMPTYWYFYVLIVLYLLFSIGSISEIKWQTKLVGLFILSLMSTFAPNISWFQISRIAYYAVYFATGIELCKGNLRLSMKQSIIMIGIGFSINLGLVILGYTTSGVPVLSVIVAFLISVGMLELFNIINVDQGKYCGLHMQEIYVTHCFVAPAIRMLLIKLNITNIVICLTLTTLLSIVFPICFGEILKKIKLYDYVFKPYSRLK